MFKFILLTLLDDTPVILNASNIERVNMHPDNPEWSEVVDFDGQAMHVQEEVKLVYEYIK